MEDSVLRRLTRHVGSVAPALSSRARRAVLKNRRGEWEWVRVGTSGGVLSLSPLLLELVCWELANESSFAASVNGRLVSNCGLGGEDGSFDAVRGIEPGWGC